MVVQENMLNAARICHGGVLFSFADYTFALISNIYGNIALAISANINLPCSLHPVILPATVCTLPSYFSNSPFISPICISLNDFEGYGLIPSFLIF